MTDSEKLDMILSEMQSMKSEMQSMKSEMQGMKSEMQDMKSEMQGLKERTESIETDVKDIKLTLENEIRVNIQRVAEGHLDLSRNLHDAMRPSNEVEMLAIKVRMLETDMRDVKARLASA